MKHDMVQLLAPDRQRVESPRFSFEGTDDDLTQYLRNTVLARRFDTEATALQRYGELGLWPPALGQETAQVGSAHALSAHDAVFLTYREHAVFLTLGLPFQQILALFRGCDARTQDQFDRFRNYQIIIGSQTLHATGYAMGLQLDGPAGNDDGDNAAVIVYYGGRASSQGDVNETHVFAISYNAPVAFFCQNSQWVISEPIALQSRIPLLQRIRGFGFPGMQVDGNDVLAIHVVTHWALERVHQGEGPTFIEAFTYRMGAHITSDDPTKYRLDEETIERTGRDPITRLTAHLKRQGVIDDAWLTAPDADARDFGAEIRAAIPKLMDLTMDELFDDVYAENTVALEAQRREYAEWAAGEQA